MLARLEQPLLAGCDEIGVVDRNDAIGVREESPKDLRMPWRERTNLAEVLLWWNKMILMTRLCVPSCVESSWAAMRCVVLRWCWAARGRRRDSDSAARESLTISGKEPFTERTRINDLIRSNRFVRSFYSITWEVTNGRQRQGKAGATDVARTGFEGLNIYFCWKPSKLRFPSKEIKKRSRSL